MWELTYVFKDVNDEKGRDEVVDALHVAAGGVSDGPDEEDALEDLKMMKKRGYQSHTEIIINKDLTNQEMSTPPSPTTLQQNVYCCYMLLLWMSVSFFDVAHH